MPPASSRLPAALAAGVLLVLAWSAVAPHDAVTWLLEALPVLVALPLLAATYRRHPLTPLAYWLIAAHCVILAIGAHYTYARVPAGDWLRDAFDLSRNHYDRLGHLAQGFVPAIVAREVLWRWSPLRGSRWLPFLAGCSCLAFSAFYELVEWWVALLSDEAAQHFLGTQGDVWDTQWDMFLALCGATAALGLLRRVHDRQLRHFATAR
jgi:putative membrane protein